MKSKSNNKYGKFSKNNFRDNQESKSFSKKKTKRTDDSQRNYSKSSNNNFLLEKNDYEYRSKNNYRKSPKNSSEIKIYKNNKQIADSNLEDFIWGKHSVLAALESGRPINRIWCTSDIRSSEKFFISLKEIKNREIFHIRFHLMPDMTSNFTNNKKNVILKTKLGNMWLFKCDTELSVENSIYVDFNKTQEIKQIVIKGVINNIKEIKKWSLKRI